MEIFSLRMGGEYSRILNLLNAGCSVKLGTTEEAMRLSPLLSLYGTDLILLGYTPRLRHKAGIFELLAAWNEDPFLAEMPVAMAVARSFVAEFEPQFRRRAGRSHRMLPIYPEDFRCAHLSGVLKGHVARFRFLREEQKTEEQKADDGNADACFELVSKGDRLAFPWESWFLAPDEALDR